MVVLTTLFLFLLTTPVFADIYQENPIEILFDYGAPEKSVAIMGRDLFEMDDRYETYRVHHFEEKAIVFEDQRDGQVIKLATKGRVDPKLRRHARNQFIVRQLESIYQAQVAYHNHYKEGYAENLEILIAQGYLADGFKKWKKQDYIFEVIETGQTPKHAMAHENMPTFYALASPILEDEQGAYFFSVDYLGQVRFGTSQARVSWGPVWDYQEHLAGPKMRDISLD